MENFVEAATYSSEVEARLAQATLSAAGITSVVKGESLALLFPNFDFTGGVKLLVPPELLEEARTVLTTGASPEDPA